LNVLTLVLFMWIKFLILYTKNSSIIV